MALHERPLSPHLQIYRPQITSVLSILHRITGTALSIGVILLVLWLCALAGGQDKFAAAQDFAASVVGRTLLFGFSFSLFYHLCNGIRHLFWDIGRGFSLPAVYRSGWAVVVISFALTLVAWAGAYVILSGVYYSW